jgi:hypothetical protein
MVCPLVQPSLTAEQIDFTLNAFRPSAAPDGARV